MARTTPELVQSILKTKVDIDLEPMIEYATELVDDQCLNSGYTEPRLEKIERLLAAHFYCIRDPRTTLEHAGSIRQFFENKVDLGLRLTRYGQQAIIMDTAGNLAALDNTMKEITKDVPGATPQQSFNITWLGTEWD